MVHFMFIAPMHSYVTNVLVYNLHITIFSRVFSYVTRLYSYVTRMCSYVTRMLLVCTRMLLVCIRVYSYVLVCYSCVVLVTIESLFSLLLLFCSAATHQTNFKKLFQILKHNFGYFFCFAYPSSMLFLTIFGEVMFQFIDIN